LIRTLSVGLLQFSLSLFLSLMTCVSQQRLLTNGVKGVKHMFMRIAVIMRLYFTIKW